ncbi:polysaccharide deacetylase family protein [Salmonirosea aquatica]|uniref:Polysaccharide deacetylase family protein n=1 Tax=Salmonirosea aquatica TaxID=2654236 RepID=A0A7C9BFT6_9BACT|nr:polysaccharide deacetylase family protein [Cytophagaceae bacterium SJW1-29]
MFLHYSPFWLKALYPSYRWRVPTSEKKLYLTFDDGPIPEVTETVLETLRDFRAKATFFCIGDNVRKHPELFKKVLAKGHLVGNHTYNHLNGWKTADFDYLANIRQCGELLPVKTKLFRPPYGRVRRSQAREIMKNNTIVMWDVLSGDFSQDISPETCLRKTIQYTRPGSILLFHDSLKARRNMDYTVPRVLDHFSNLDYRFEVLPTI